MAESSINIRKRKTKTKGVVYEYYFNHEHVRYSQSGFSTAAKAKAAGKKKYVDVIVNKPKRLDSKCIKVKDVFDLFLKNGDAVFSINTINKANRLLNSLYESNLGDIYLSDVNTQDIQHFLNSIYTKSYDTNKMIKNHLSFMFVFANKSGYIKGNPVKDALIHGKKPEGKKTSPLTNEQITMLFNSLDEYSRRYPKRIFKFESYKMAIKLGYYLGLRIAEAMALKKEDINLDTKKAFIHRELIYQGLKKEDVYIEERTKTKSSRAEIPIPDVFVKELREWMNKNPYETVLANPDGSYIHPFCFNRTMHHITDRLGFSFHYHLLRHTYATNLVTGNTPIKVAQELLRHSSIQTTLQIYTHIDQNAKYDAVNSIFRMNI